VSALATGDIDGNGTPDLVVGQSGSGAIAAWSGQTGGGFLAAPGIVPPLPIDVARLYLVEALQLASTSGAHELVASLETLRRSIAS